MTYTYTTTIIKRRPANWKIGRRMNRSRAGKPQDDPWKMMAGRTITEKASFVSWPFP